MVKVICVNGVSRSGKDTFIKFIREQSETTVVVHSTIDTIRKMLIESGLMVGDRKLLSPLNGLEEMGKIATGMLSKSIVAFLAVDVETARKIPSEDDKVDALFNKIYRELINIMIDDPSSVEFANHLQWAVHNIERMADRVTNICERTIFIDTGLINEIEDEETHSFH